MTDRMRQIGLAAGAVLMALGMAAGVFAAAQNQNTNDSPQTFSSGRMGPHFGGGLLGLPFSPMGLAGPLADRLGLTDDQKTQLKAIVAAHQDEFKTFRDRAAEAHKALAQAILTDPVDDSAVQQASAGLASVQSDLAVFGAHLRAQMFQVLTDDQKATIKQLVANPPRPGRGR
jgi:Spy/CpxP family protein refolding chaperone